MTRRSQRSRPPRGCGVSAGDSALLHSLERLSLRWAGATGANAIAITRDPHFAKLRYMALKSHYIGAMSFLAVARARHMDQLCHFAMGGSNPISPRVTRAYREAPHLKYVRLY